MPDFSNSTRVMSHLHTVIR